MREILKKWFDKIKSQKLKYNILQAFPFWIASVVAGLSAVLYTKLFVWTEGVSRAFIQQHKWWFLLLSPLTFVFAFFIVKKWARYARGSGIPQVMAAMEMPSGTSTATFNKFVGVKVIIVKIVSSLLMVLGGGAVGREGPTIQISASIFRKINQWIPDSWPKISKRTMILTGAAAGLAAAFNTPLGGIVFAVEELSNTHIRFYRTAIFSAVIIAGLTAQGLLGPYLYLGYPNVTNPSPYIFGGIILVAIISGLSASILSKIMLQLFAWKQKFTTMQQYLYVIVCALLLVLVALSVNNEVLWSGKDVMNGLLFNNDKTQPFYLPLLRLLGPALSFTTGAAGGIFSPALSAGASIGGWIAQWFHLSSVNTNLLILSGMAGFLTGITRSPFTSAILVLEMTDRHSVIFHLMLAAMVASLVSLLIDKHSFYDHLKHQFLIAFKEEEEVEKRKKAELDSV